MKIIPNHQILDALRCPLCHSAMSLDMKEGGGASLVCAGARRHCYDMASSGYVNMAMPGRTDGGDSKEAVRARRDFLSLEYYAPAAKALANTVREFSKPGLVIDAGCGEGYYSAHMAELGYSVAGIDLSRPAVDCAAKRFSRMGLKEGFFGVGSVYSLPFADGSASALVNVFAPCSEEEFSRVLRSDGILSVMYAGPEHLMGLKRAIYDQVHENDGRADLPHELKKVDERRIFFEIQVEGRDALQNLFAMTPYYWKTSKEDGEKLQKLTSLTTTVDMIIGVYQKKSKE
ncbi:MAG: methyltransferase domain-containing protein [Clostridia bacterium]|nr:methyltransferase domain-containing protein [Clostridia bacterium]